LLHQENGRHDKRVLPDRNCKSNNSAREYRNIRHGNMKIRADLLILGLFCDSVSTDVVKWHQQRWKHDYECRVDNDLISLTLKVPSADNFDLTKTAVFDSKWHLLAIYLNYVYVVRKHLKGSFSLHLKFFVSLYAHKCFCDLALQEFRAETSRIKAIMGAPIRPLQTSVDPITQHPKQAQSIAKDVFRTSCLQDWKRHTPYGSTQSFQRVLILRVA
jgi:hypothetical protein